MTKAKDVKGLIFTDSKMANVTVTVRVTSDAIGKSLSLTAANHVMIEIPMEPVSRLLKINEEVFR